MIYRSMKYISVLVGNSKKALLQMSLCHSLCRSEECFPDQRHGICQCVDAVATQSLRDGPSTGGEAAQDRTGLHISSFTFLNIMHFSVI